MVGDSTVVVAWVGGGGGSAGGAGEQVAWAFTRQSEPVRAAIVGGATATMHAWYSPIHAWYSHPPAISQRCGLGLELDGKLMYDGYSM